MNLKNTIPILILSLSLVLSCKCQTQENESGNRKTDQPVIISAYLESGARRILNYTGPYLDFKNLSKKDTLLVKIIKADRPIHFFYSNLAMNGITETKEFGSLLLFPGDSIILNRNGTLVSYSTGFQNFIDSFITIPPVCYDPNLVEENNKLKSIGLKSMLEAIANAYHKNQEAIKQLDVEAELKSFLQNFNEITRAYQICFIPIEKLNNADKDLLDIEYKHVLSHIDEITSIDSQFPYTVFYNLIKYNVYRKGIGVTDFWTFFYKVDNTISQSGFYQPYIITSLKMTWENNPDGLKNISEKLKTIKTPSGTVDTISKLADILLKTKENYLGAKEDLDKYADGRFSYLLDERDVRHREQRNIKSLEPVNLISFDRKRFPFQTELFKGNPKIVVLDFWASWCIPCVMDYPYLKKIEESLKDKPIKFIGISIDLEKDVNKWIERTKELKTFNKPNQFRLEDPTHSAINSYFNLHSVPRYIVIDDTGKILEEVFDRPNEPGFKRKLERYLMEN